MTVCRTRGGPPGDDRLDELMQQRSTLDDLYRECRSGGRLHLLPLIGELRRDVEREIRARRLG